MHIRNITSVYCIDKISIWKTIPLDDATLGYPLGWSFRTWSENHYHTCLPKVFILIQDEEWVFHPDHVALCRNKIFWKKRDHCSKCEGDDCPEDEYVPCNGTFPGLCKPKTLFSGSEESEYHKTGFYILAQSIFLSFFISFHWGNVCSWHENIPAIVRWVLQHRYCWSQVYIWRCGHLFQRGWTIQYDGN